MLHVQLRSLIAGVAIITTGVPAPITEVSGVPAEASCSCCVEVVMTGTFHSFINSATGCNIASREAHDDAHLYRAQSEYAEGEGGEARETSPRWAYPSAGEDEGPCAGICRRDVLDSAGTHFTFHPEYVGGSCATHRKCPNEGHEPTVLSAWDSSDYRELAALLVKAPESVLLSRDRGMIQLLDCTGNVYVQLPVDVARLLAAVTSTRPTQGTRSVAPAWSRDEARGDV